MFDVRHNLVIASVYELPFGPGKRFLQFDGAIGQVLGGWSLSGLGVFHTGHPLTVAIGLDPTQAPFGDSRANQRPDIVPGVPIVPPNQNPNNWVNIAAFAQPPQDANGVDTHFGDARNGIVRAPNVWEADIALQKSTKLGEKTALEFRAEAFNIFNHRQLGDPSHLDILSSSNFGQIDTPVSFNPNNDNFVEPATGLGAAANLAAFFPREVLATACGCRPPDTKFRLPALTEGSSSLSRLAIRKDNDALLGYSSEIGLYVFQVSCTCCVAVLRCFYVLRSKPAS